MMTMGCHNNGSKDNAPRRQGQWPLTKDNGICQVSGAAVLLSVEEWNSLLSCVSDIKEVVP